MTALADRTALPPTHPEQLTEVLALIAPEPPRRRATLTGLDGTRLELPGEVFDALREVVAALSQGFAVTLTMLSTSEAGQLLKVSQPGSTARPEWHSSDNCSATTPGPGNLHMIPTFIDTRVLLKPYLCDTLLSIAEADVNRSLFSDKPQRLTATGRDVPSPLGLILSLTAISRNGRSLFKVPTSSDSRSVPTGQRRSPARADAESLRKCRSAP
jgi:hypothetical protein